jgi:hypothetical protein
LTAFVITERVPSTPRVDRLAFQSVPNEHVTGCEVDGAFPLRDEASYFTPMMKFSSEGSVPSACPAAG